MIVATVTTPVPMLTATGRKSPRHFTMQTETRCTTPKEMRNALKLSDHKRPMFKILGLHPGYGTRFLAAACIALAFILAVAPASHAGWSHGNSGGSGRSHHARNASSSSGATRSHHRKSY